MEYSILISSSDLETLRVLEIGTELKVVVFFITCMSPS
jgi:hypothetical protein